MTKRNDRPFIDVTFLHVLRKTHRGWEKVLFLSLQENRNTHFQRIKRLWTAIHLKKKENFPEQLTKKKNLIYGTNILLRVKSPYLNIYKSYFSQNSYSPDSKIKAGFGVGAWLIPSLNLRIMLFKEI